MAGQEFPVTIIIFGASGDLTQRKLVPALYNLHRKGRLPAGARIVGFARRPFSNQEFRDRLKAGLLQHDLHGFSDQGWDDFSSRIEYYQGDLNLMEDFNGLDAALKRLEGGGADRLYYLATSPDLYEKAVENLGAAGMATEVGGRRHLVVEKPFGRDLASAQALSEAIHSVFKESQVFRIDHYLGKETAQNILFIRFANTIFEPVWSRQYVDNVQITVAESLDVGHRAGYYDGAGVLRDMFQNHLLQLLTLIAMEPPASFDADALRNEKVKVLSAIRPVTLEDTVRAMYDGYCSTLGVAPDSQTPTFAALKLYIHNWRWMGVPFYLRSGKSLARKTSEIIVEFQDPPNVMFDLAADADFHSNRISICIQPDEGIHLKFETKIPDSAHKARSVDMEFHYCSSMEGEAMPDAYERLILDAMQGDASLFARSDEIEKAWGLIDPIIQGWETQQSPPLVVYEPGSWGPPEAGALLERDGREWRTGCLHEGEGS